MDTFTATMIAEGAEEADSEEQYLEAWQTLVNTGLAWTLQGFFGRTATRLLEAGLITRPAPKPEKPELPRAYMLTAYCVHTERGYSVALAMAPTQKKAVALAHKLFNGKKESLTMANMRSISRDVFIKVEPWTKEVGTGVCVQEGRPVKYWEVNKFGTKEYTLCALGYNGEYI
jgi:hypothetical protein